MHINIRPKTLNFSFLATTILPRLFVTIKEKTMPVSLFQDHLIYNSNLNSEEKDWMVVEGREACVLELALVILVLGVEKGFIIGTPGQIV